MKQLQENTGGTASTDKGEATTSSHNAYSGSELRSIAEKRNLTTKEAALESGLSTKTVLKWIRTGKIKVVPHLRPYRVSRASLLALLEGRYV